MKKSKKLGQSATDSLLNLMPIIFTAGLIQKTIANFSNRPARERKEIRELLRLMTRLNHQGYVIEIKYSPLLDKRLETKVKNK